MNFWWSESLKEATKGVVRWYQIKLTYSLILLFNIFVDIKLNIPTILSIII